MEDSSLAINFEERAINTGSEDASLTKGPKQSWMLDHSPGHLPAGISPFGEGTQQQWERLSPLERLMLVDSESLKTLALQESAIETARLTPGQRVVDACCGVGASAIAFALTGKMVTAIDTDRSKLEMAQFNATLFGVAGMIRWIQGEALDLIPWVEADSVFIDSRWDSARRRTKGYTFEASTPNARALLEQSHSEGRNVVLRLPLEFDLDELLTVPSPVRVFSEVVRGERVGYTAVLKAA